MRDGRLGIRRAAEDRDSARVRVRRVTGGVIAASVVVTGALAGYVSNAGSAGTKAKQTTIPLPEPTPTQTTPAQVPVPDTPPSPTLIPSESAPSSPQPSVQAPQQVPVQTPQPPVVVSGGS